MKDTKTPWRTATQASEAIKLALGIVEYGKTVGGQFMQWPLSRKELDDKDLADAVRDMASLLHKMTGVDPLEWNRETADVGRDEQPADFSDAGSGRSGAEIGSDTTSPAAADQSARAADQEDGAEPHGASAGDDAPSSDLDPVKRMLMEECIDNVLREAFSEPAIDRPAKVDKIEEVFLEPQNLGSHPEFVRRCAETARRIIGKPHERQKAREYLMSRVK